MIIPVLALCSDMISAGMYGWIALGILETVSWTKPLCTAVE